MYCWATWRWRHALGLSLSDRWLQQTWPARTNSSSLVSLIDQSSWQDMQPKGFLTTASALRFFGTGKSPQRLASPYCSDAQTQGTITHFAFSRKNKYFLVEPRTIVQLIQRLQCVILKLDPQFGFNPLTIITHKCKHILGIFLLTCKKYS